MKSVGVAVVAVTVTAVAAAAHHSPAAFDLRTQVTIQGRVARLDWTNPHVYIYAASSLASIGPSAIRSIGSPFPTIRTRSAPPIVMKPTLPHGSVGNWRTDGDRRAG